VAAPAAETASDQLTLLKEQLRAQLTLHAGFDHAGAAVADCQHGKHSRVQRYEPIAVRKSSGPH